MHLSIIIPVYNVEPYIKGTLDSVFQTTACKNDFEVIVVNDGTQDNSMTIVRQFTDNPNLLILEQKNSGLSAARMAGLAKANGDYVWFIDSDDWIVDNGVGIVLDLLSQRPDSDVLMFPILRCFDDVLKNRVDYHVDKEQLVDGKTIIKEHSLPLYSAVRYVFKRSLTRNPFLYFPSGLIHEDEYFGPVLMCLAKRVSVFDIALYVHPQREGSIMTSLTVRSSYDIVSIHKQLMCFMKYGLSMDEWPWFRSYCWSILELSFKRNTSYSRTKDFTRFLRDKGIYLWRQWRASFRDSSLCERIERFCFFVMPRFYRLLSKARKRIRLFF